MWRLVLLVLFHQLLLASGGDIFEGGEEDVRRFLEMAQETAEEKKHTETAPVHILDALVKNSRIHHALPKEDGIDLDEFLSGALKRFPKRKENEQQQEENGPPFSSASFDVVSAAKELGENENSPKSKPYHLFEALFGCDEIVTPLTSQFFDTMVVEHSLTLMKAARRIRREREVGECEAEEEGKEGGEEKEEEEERYQESLMKKTPDWLKNKIGEGSGWGMFLNTTYKPSLSSSVVHFGFDVLELIPENSIIILTGQPLYQVFLELPNIVRKDILNLKKMDQRLTEENTAGIRGLRGDVYPIYTGYLKDETFAQKKSSFFPKITFPAEIYSPHEQGKNKYNLLEFIEANFENHHVFMATDPLEDKEGVWEDLGWEKDYSLVPHGFCHKLIKHSEMKEKDWYQPHLAAVSEMTKKIEIQKQFDETIKGAFWNIIRLQHKKILGNEEEKTQEEISQVHKDLTIFLRKLLKKPSGAEEFVPLDILYMQCLSYMKWVYPEIGGEGLPDPQRFRKSRKKIEYIIRRYQAHPKFDDSNPGTKETIRSFFEYLEVTEKALKEWEEMNLGS